MRRIAPKKYAKNDNPYYLKTFALHLDPAQFNALIAEYGIRLLHEKVTLCPNYRGEFDSNVHILDCPLCNGSNFIHFDPQEIWGFFQQNQLAENFLTQGWWDRGTALLTVPTHIETTAEHPIYINYFDRITILDFEERFYEMIHKSQGDIDKLKYEALSIQFLRTANKEYKVDRDFTIDGGNIRWLSENRPTYDLEQDVGELFTISYLRRPVYRVLELLHEGRYSQFNLKKPIREAMRYPQQCVIKKDFLIQTGEAESKMKNTVDASDLLPKGP